MPSYQPASQGHEARWRSIGGGVDDLKLRLVGVALGLVGLRAEGHGSRHLAFSQAGGDFVGFWASEQRLQRSATRYAGGERLFDSGERGVLGGFRLCLALAFISFVNVVAAPRYPGGHSVAGYRGATNRNLLK